MREKWALLSPWGRRVIPVSAVMQMASELVKPRLLNSKPTARTFLTVQTHHKTLHLPAYLGACLNETTTILPNLPPQSHRPLRVNILWLRPRPLLGPRRLLDLCQIHPIQHLQVHRRQRLGQLVKPSHLGRQRRRLCLANGRGFVADVDAAHLAKRLFKHARAHAVLAKVLAAVDRDGRGGGVDPEVAVLGMSVDV